MFFCDKTKRAHIVRFICNTVMIRNKLFFISILFLQFFVGAKISGQVTPNFVILLADDLGYSDLACYGHPSQEFGSIDRMAAQGLRFTNFYSADSVCTPSRAGLMTGRLPVRLGMFPSNINRHRVLMPTDKGGLPLTENTIAEQLKSLGYKTGMVGKWHLGINAQNSTDGTYLPGNRGFDFVGTNLPFHVRRNCDDDPPPTNDCFVYNGSLIMQQPIKFEKLTQRLVDDFKTFVSANEKSPFFFYFSFPQVHVSLFASKRFKGFSGRGLYGDSTNEMAWAVGEVLDYLKAKMLAENTLVLFMSDHGPHEDLCQFGGVSAHFKGQKSTTWEGGFRIPAIAWMPGTIPPGVVSHSVLSSLDIFPSFTALARGQLPQNRIFDGIDSSTALFGKWTSEFRRPAHLKRLILYYCNEHLMAVRYGQYKAHFRTIPLETVDRDLQCPGGVHIQKWYSGITNCPGKGMEIHNPPLLFDLFKDPQELYSLDASEMTEIMNEITLRVEEHQRTVSVGKSQLDELDPDLQPCCNAPKCRCDNFGDDDELSENLCVKKRSEEL